MNNPQPGFPDPAQPIFALGWLGEEALPPILTVLADSHHLDRAAAAWIIGTMRDLGTNRVRAVPLLLRCLTEKDEAIARHAAAALGELGMEPALVVPTLANSLGDPIVVVRRLSAHSLGLFAGQAQMAIPALVQSLNDTNASVREEATNALRQIAPEVLKKKGTR